MSQWTVLLIVQSRSQGLSRPEFVNTVECLLLAALSLSHQAGVGQERTLITGQTKTRAIQYRLPAKARLIEWQDVVANDEAGGTTLRGPANR